MAGTLAYLTPPGQAPNYSNPNAPNYISREQINAAAGPPVRLLTPEERQAAWDSGKGGQMQREFTQRAQPFIEAGQKLGLDFSNMSMDGMGMMGGKGGGRETSSTTDLPIPVEHQERRGSVLAKVYPSNPQPGNINANGKGGTPVAQPAPASSSPTLGTSSTVPALPAPAPSTPSTTSNNNGYRPFGGLLGGFAGNNFNNPWSMNSGNSGSSGTSGGGTGLGALLTGIGKK